MLAAEREARRGDRRVQESTERLPPLRRVLAVVGDGVQSQQQVTGEGESAVQREPNARERVGLLLHAVATISAFLDRGYAPYWTISRACEHNLTSLLPRLASLEPTDMNVHYRAYLFTKGLIYAVKNDNMELVQWLCCEYCPGGFVWQAVEEAAALGNTRTLEWLVTRYEYVLTNPHLMDVAAKNGHIETLRWLNTHFENPPGCSHTAMKQITADGDLEIVQRLLEQYPERANEQYLDSSIHRPYCLTDLRQRFDCRDVIFAAASSKCVELFRWVHEQFYSTNALHMLESCNLSSVIRSAITFGVDRAGDALDPVVWLHEQYPYNWTADAMDFAAASDALAIVEWLRANRTEGCTRKAMDGAAENGHLRMMEWLHINLRPGCTSNAVKLAARNGHLPVLKWLHANGYEGFSTSTMDEAAASSHMGIVKWLGATRSEGCTHRAMDGAAENNHLETVKWLHENRSEGCTTQAMDKAAGQNHLEIAKWLHANRSEGCTTKAMDTAAAKNHLDMVKWLHENRNEGCTTAAMDEAAKSNHFEMVKWLHVNRYEGCTTAAIDSASSLEMVQWLLENRTEGFTAALLFNAAIKGVFELVQLALTGPHVSTSNLRQVGKIAIVNHHFELLQLVHEMNPEYLSENWIRNCFNPTWYTDMLALVVHMRAAGQLV